MYCKVCGTDVGNSNFCPNCGARQNQPPAPRPAGQNGQGYAQEQSYAAGQTNYGQYDQTRQPGAAWQPDQYAQQTAYGESPVVSGFRRAFTDPLFVIITCLITLCAVLSFFTKAINVIYILLAIGMWIAFAAAKNREKPFGTTGPAMISGTLKAIVIINWVIVALLAVLALACIVLRSSIIDILPSLFMSSGAYDSIIGNEYYYWLLRSSVSTIMTVVAVALLIGAAVLAVFNVCYHKKVHKLAKSVCESIRSGYMQVEKANAVKNWLMVLGIITAVVLLVAAVNGGNSVTVNYSDYYSWSPDLSSVWGKSMTLWIISGVADVIAMILGSVLIGKYLVPKAGNTAAYV